MSGRPGAFLDRDGTIIRDTSYIGSPRDVELIPGAAEAIRQLSDRGFAVVVVTNQSGIARGLLTLDAYGAVEQRVLDLLGAEGARVEATYMCPHHPDVTGPCDCRKPGLALYRQAIAEHDIDPRQSVFIGDRWRDIEPAIALGGVGILLDVDSTHPEERDRAAHTGIETAGSLKEAVERYLDALPAAPVRQ